MRRTGTPIALCLLLGACGDDTAGMSPESESSSSSEGSGESSGGFVSACVRDDAPPPDPQGVIFVNFAGVELVASSGPAIDRDDSQSNVVGEPPFAGAYAPFDERRDRDCVLEAVREDFARFNIWVTDERPPDVMQPQLDGYTMVVVSADAAGLDPVTGTDCSNGLANNVAFASSADPLTPAAQARLVSRAAARSFGLRDVHRPGALMEEPAFPPVDADAVFLDECLPTVDTVCGNILEEDCPPGRQNAVRRLRTLFPY